MLKDRLELIVNMYLNKKTISKIIWTFRKKQIMKQANKIWKKIERIFEKNKSDTTFTILVGMIAGINGQNEGKVYYMRVNERRWNQLIKKNIKHQREVWEALREKARAEGLTVKKFDNLIDKRYSENTYSWYYFIHEV